MTTGGTILVVGAPGGQLLPADTAGALYTFELADLVADIDGDALPDTWEQQFGLNPLSEAGADGASGDPDGDRITNAAEFSGQTHPVNLASATRYLAEGATGFFETRISLANPGPTEAHVLLRFLRNDGTVRSHVVSVPAQQSRKVAVSFVPDMSAAEFSTVIESNQPVVVDRQMWWDTTSAYGTNAESSLQAPSLQWYFAEGATQGGFDLFYLLQNPSDSPARLSGFDPPSVGGPLGKDLRRAAAKPLHHLGRHGGLSGGFGRACTRRYRRRRRRRGAQRRADHRRARHVSFPPGRVVRGRASERRRGSTGAALVPGRGRDRIVFRSLRTVGQPFIR